VTAFGRTAGAVDRAAIKKQAVDFLNSGAIADAEAEKERERERGTERERREERDRERQGPPPVRASGTASRLLGDLTVGLALTEPVKASTDHLAKLKYLETKFMVGLPHPTNHASPRVLIQPGS
jgi:hypothetical protein